MSCFIVPLAEAVAVSTVKKTSRKSAGEKPAHKHLATLEKMLYAGSGLLFAEHVYHGELNPFAAGALHEMATTGVCMAASVTALWGLCLLIGKLRGVKFQPNRVQTGLLMTASALMMFGVDALMAI